MRRGLILTAAAGLLAFAMNAALAAPIIPAASARATLPLQQISVFCGQHGCQNVTRVKRCNINSHEGEQNQQNGIRRLANCNG